jgi:hypothetical protein
MLLYALLADYGELCSQAGVIASSHAAEPSAGLG